MDTKILPLVVIFGRTNVGKSTLFNVLTETKRALTSNTPGTTRDSKLATVEWNGKKFEIVDTGGIMDEIQNASSRKIKHLLKEETTGEKLINLKVQQQALTYLSKADLILFVVDGRTGLMPQDKEMAKLLKRIIPQKDKDKLILVANKIDSTKISQDSAEFNKLGMNDPMLVSSKTGRGTGDLLDEITDNFKKRKIKAIKVKENKLENISVCLLGKPNVGKSSLFNKLLGDEKVIVSEIPHTTREPNDMMITYEDKNITFIDTAGISKKGKFSKGLEKYGIQKTLATLKKSDIVLLVIDISEKITHQDAKLVQEIVEAGKSLVIIANKWDKIEPKDTKKFTQYIYGKLPFATWAPIQFTSAFTGSKVNKLLDLVIMMDGQRKIELSDSQLDKFLKRIVKIHKPTKGKGTKKPRIFELIQIGTNPPSFKARIRSMDNLANSYIRFMKNQLRDQFGFLGTPVKLYIANNPKVHGKEG